MTDPYNKAEIIAAIQADSQKIAQNAAAMTEAQLFAVGVDAWSAGDYLKHLILSVKPMARVFELPPDKVGGRFGMADRPSVTYAELGQKYDAGLAAGIRAEMYDKVVPANYNLPPEVTDQTTEKTYLIETWQAANERLVAALATWSEDDLDRYMIPHPALSDTTAREILFFTVHHARLHGADIDRVGGASQV